FLNRNYKMLAFVFEGHLLLLCPNLCFGCYKQKLSPNEAQTSFIRSKYVTIMGQQRHFTSDFKSVD
ncbi:MAG: hypothetical protein PUQ00_23125, partial [Nostoc sp. S13]|nr:hypothetical protein [Nostoc sp. S13]